MVCASGPIPQPFSRYITIRQGGKRASHARHRGRFYRPCLPEMRIELTPSTHAARQNYHEETNSFLHFADIKNTQDLSKEYLLEKIHTLTLEAGGRTVAPTPSGGANK
jgi:hypothetical protein